jgi:GPH family glycoside/pentoside/hexuronide:cation symporter
LDVQPATVNAGFRIFMTIPPLVGSLLAMLALYFYPLHGARLREIKKQL